jgi:hypothetical protein
MTAKIQIRTFGLSLVGKQDFRSVLDDRELAFKHRAGYLALFARLGFLDREDRVILFVLALSGPAAFEGAFQLFTDLLRLPIRPVVCAGSGKFPNLPLKTKVLVRELRW